MSAERFARALELLEEATSYTSCQSWSPSMTEEINKFIADQKAAVNTGFDGPTVVVPLYPTTEMLDAGRWCEYYEESSLLRDVDDDEVASMWSAMVGAAPTGDQQ